MAALTGKTALVTGASRGIGRAIALRFAREGAIVAVHYGRSAKEANEVVAQIEAEGGRAFAVQADVSKVADITALFETLDKEFAARTGDARFDILVNNAAISEQASIAEITEEQFDRHFDTNVKGPFFTAQQALPRLRDNGRIINVTSAITRLAFPDFIAYAATKGALDIITRNLAVVAGERGITVNGLAPGAIDTDMNPWVKTPEGRQMVADMGSIKRVGLPVDVADAALLLASEDARWITANYLDVSGGAKL